MDVQASIFFFFSFSRMNVVASKAAYIHNQASTLQVPTLSDLQQQNIPSVIPELYSTWVG